MHLEDNHVVFLLFRTYFTLITQSSAQARVHSLTHPRLLSPTLFVSELLARHQRGNVVVVNTSNVVVNTNTNERGDTVGGVDTNG